MELRLLGCAEAAVLPLQLRKMSDSEDSNFSEEEDSERSSEAEEAEVSDLDSRGDVAPGDGDRAVRLPREPRTRHAWGFSDRRERRASRQLRVEQRDRLWKAGMRQGH